MQLAQKIGIARRVLSANFRGKRFPLAVYMHVTDRCPLRCSYCEIPNHPRAELSTKDILGLIEQISKAGAQRFHINGGEPLMREDIGEIIDYAKRKNLFVSMSSNGYLVSKKIKQLRKLDIVFLSFDGPKEVHDGQRGEGSYEKLIEGFKLFKEYGIKFWTNTVLTKNNFNVINFILGKAKEYRFAASFQVLYYPPGHYCENSFSSHPLQALLLTREEYRDTFRMLIEEKKKGSLVVNSREFLEYLLSWDDYGKIYSTQAKRYIQCWAGKLYCWVDINGAVYPCYDCIGKIGALNFLDVGFQNAFDGIKEPPCRSCILSCYTEMNLMFSLNAKTIFNYLRVV